MNIPVSKDLSTSRGLVEVWIEETTNLDFDLSGDGEYVDTGAVEGKIQVEFELNRSELMNRLDRAKSPSIKDQINMFLEDWSDDAMNKNKVNVNYGRLLLKGAEPTELSTELSLGQTFDARKLKQTSPDDLKRELRKELNYKMTYDDLEDDVKQYLQREGIAANPSFSAPVHIQAKSKPSDTGTDFTIVVENNEQTVIKPITIKVDMPQSIGTETSLGHDYSSNNDEKWVSESDVTGSYDPEDQKFVFDVKSLEPANKESSKREIRFHVPGRAQDTLKEISGVAEFTRNTPFSNIEPVAVFDAGGHRLDSKLGAVSSTGRIEATFQTPTDAITVSGIAKVQKRFQVKGVTPIDAFQEIEDMLKDRGIEGADFKSPDESRDIREGKATYDSSIRNGSVLVGDTRVSLDIHVDGEVRASNRETSRDDDENLPAERRSVTVEYGKTGVNIIGKGADQGVVDDYVTDLRNELQMSLRSIAEAM